MPSLEAVQAANATFEPNYVPVMVITGSTLGIGRSIVEIFAKYQTGRTHIVLIARNKEAADNIIAGLPQAVQEQGCTYEFVACDLKLMKNIHEVAKDLVTRLPKINFLVHSAGVASLEGRVETEEGIDEKMAIRYYCRFALTYDLMPLLRKASDVGEKAGVLSILGAGLSPELIEDDLGLKKNHAGWKAMFQTGTYNDLMIAEFARREPGISFVYTWPGWVNTMQPTALHYKLLKCMLQPIMWLVLTKPEICAEYMLYSLLASGTGMTRTDNKGNDIGMKKFPATTAGQDMLWEHSLKETGALDLTPPSL
ncbi:hypothetical protein BJ165DRAFT_1340814 [Panaeolus papilionaceus]|nr:hypothetical protein BJ165DRAFT_1340814 [Panaeolus papilionaceus]